MSNTVESVKTRQLAAALAALELAEKTIYKLEASSDLQRQIGMLVHDVAFKYFDELDADYAKSGRKLWRDQTAVEIKAA